MYLKRRIIIILWFIVQLHSGFGQCYTITYRNETKFPDFAIEEFMKNLCEVPFSVEILTSNEKISLYKNLEYIPYGSGYSLINRYYFKNKQSGYTCMADMSYPDTLGTQFPSMTAENWDILEDTLTIRGITCQKAVLIDADRYIEAYFDPAFPIQDGPESYCGLPGLIVRVDLPTHTVTLSDIRYDKNCIIKQPEDFCIKYVTPQDWEEYVSATVHAFAKGVKK